MKRIVRPSAVLVALFGIPILQASDQSEYAAGEVAIPLTYTAKVSSAPRPEALEFTEEHGFPDSSQVFVRMEGELWEFKMRYTALPLEMPARYKGPDIDHLVRQKDDVTMPKGHLAWFMGGIWYDGVGKKLYAPMHIEALGINRDRPVAPWPARKIILATSTDQGKTWNDEGDIITPETYFGILDAYKFSGSDYSNGLCDYGFYADERSGYFYIFPSEGWIPKGTTICRWSARAARCAFADKMAPGKWQFYYNGKWDQPALGGKSTVVAPVMWGVTYSTSLKKYICMFPSNGGVNNADNYDGIYLGCCSDLSKEDWIWIRCPQAQFGFVNVMNGEGTDNSSFERSLRFYSYFNGNVFQRLDMTFGEGQMVGEEVHVRYTFESHPESSDHLQGRRTKFVGSRNPEIKYSGDWSEKEEASSYEGRLKECGTVGSMSFKFTGPAIYWRAERSPDCGKADVYVDGRLRKTVDCYSTQSTDFEQIVYFLEGLDADSPHVFKAVVRGDKHTGSRGSTIRSIGFEYAAECYKASAGFCSIAGKDGWSYRERESGKPSEMSFAGNEGAFVNYWAGHAAMIGPNYQCVYSGAAVREWVAPHAGAVRIEGQVEATTWTDGVSASIEADGNNLWPTAPLIANVPRVHDLTLDVRQGEVISFVVKKENPENRTDASGDRVLWDPVITFIHCGNVPSPLPELPGNRNLALGKYARGKRLDHAYSPFKSVDGSYDSAFSLSPTDWTSHSGEEWLMVDLEQACLIDRYVVVSNPKDSAWRMGAFVLQKSDDRFSWTDVDRADAGAQTRFEKAVSPFRSRYVRILVPKGRPIFLNEFELYHTDGQPVSVRSPTGVIAE